MYAKSKSNYLAQAIVVESKSKFPKNVEVRTIHSIAFAFAKEKLGTFRPINKLNRFDLEEIIEQNLRHNAKYSKIPNNKYLNTLTIKEQAQLRQEVDDEMNRDYGDEL